MSTNFSDIRTKNPRIFRKIENGRKVVAIEEKTRYNRTYISSLERFQIPLRNGVAEMLKKLTMLLLVFALVLHTAVPAAASASEYDNRETREETDGGVLGPTSDSDSEPTTAPESTTVPETDPEPTEAPDLDPKPDPDPEPTPEPKPEPDPEPGPVLDPEEPEFEKNFPEEGEIEPAIIDEEGDEDKSDADWEEAFFALQSASEETFDYVYGHFDELFNYLLDHHILNARAFEVYFILYEELLDLFVANTDIQLEVILGDLTYREGVRRLRANLAAMEALIPRVQNFDPGNPDASLRPVDPANPDHSPNGPVGGPGGIGGGGNGGNGRFRLPQTGAAIASFTLAGVALLGSGTTAVLFKKRTQLDEQFDLGDLL